MMICKLTKAQLLTVLESTPQRYWPPRPTRQSQATLADCIERARTTIGFNEGERFRAALIAAGVRKETR
jgi:hypothetical protein